MLNNMDSTRYNVVGYMPKRDEWYLQGSFATLKEAVNSARGLKAQTTRSPQSYWMVSKVEIVKTQAVESVHVFNFEDGEPITIKAIEGEYDEK